MWKWMGLFLTKNHLLRCWGWLSILNWIGALKSSLLLKLPPRKLEPWLILWNFFLLRLLCISINLPYGHVWNTVVMSGLVLLWNTVVMSGLVLQQSSKRICRTVGPSFAASLETLAHCQNVSSLSFFYTYYFGRCSSELAQLVPFPYSRGRSTRYSNRLHDFSVTTSRRYKNVSTGSFLTQLGSGILCLQNAFLSPMILVVLRPELRDIF